MRTAAILKLRSDVEQQDEDPFKDGDVIRWKRRYSGTRKTYLYAALRAGGRWFITGPRSTSGGMSYEQLVRQHLNIDGVRKIAVAVDEAFALVDQKPKAKTKLSAETATPRMHLGCPYEGMSSVVVPIGHGDCTCNP